MLSMYNPGLNQDCNGLSWIVFDCTWIETQKSSYNRVQSGTIVTIESQPKIQDNPDFSRLYTDCTQSFGGIFPLRLFLQSRFNPNSISNHHSIESNPSSIHINHVGPGVLCPGLGGKVRGGEVRLG